jgi:hypothetical protein
VGLGSRSVKPTRRQGSRAAPFTSHIYACVQRLRGRPHPFQTGEATPAAMLLTVARTTSRWPNLLSQSACVVPMLRRFFRLRPAVVNLLKSRQPVNCLGAAGEILISIRFRLPLGYRERLSTISRLVGIVNGPGSSLLFRKRHGCGWLPFELIHAACYALLCRQKTLRSTEFCRTALA